MAPTEEQQRTDTALNGYLNQWNNLPAAQKTGPAGTDLKNLIELTVMNRNGSAAAQDIRTTLDGPANAAPIKISDLDTTNQRVDGSPEPAPAPPAPAPTDLNLELPAGIDNREGEASEAYNASPGDGRKWLPGNAELPQSSNSDLRLLQDRDDAIEAINTKYFAVDPALAWHMTGAHLPTGTNISTLGKTYTETTNLLRKFAEAVFTLESALSVGSFEKLISDQNERVGPSLASLANSVAASVDLPGRIATGGIAANDAFHQMRGENLNQRESIARQISAGFGAPRWAGNLELPEVTQPSKTAEVGAAAAVIGAMTSQISTPEKIDTQLVAATDRDNPGPVNPVVKGLPGNNGGLLGQLPPNLTTPGGAPLGAGTQLGGAKTPSTDEIAKLLGQLTNSAGPLAQQAAQLPQQLAQQGAQLPQQAANAIRNAAQNPDSMLRRLRGADPQNARLAASDQAAAVGAGTDRAAATMVAYTPPNPAAAAALGAPGSPARPHQLDATGKPVDRDGDGRVDNSAVPLSKNTVKPFDLLVPADGQNMMVKGVTDPRIGEMMLDMADTDGGKPLSVLEAAKAAGMDIPALGDPMDSDKAAVGDAVIGDDKSGLYVGDGKVLTSTGSVENMDDVLGESGFVSKIPLPELPENPTDNPGTITVGDTSPPTTNTSGSGAIGVSNPESGPTPEPAKTPPPAPAAAAEPPVVAAPVAPAPAPAPAPASPAPPPVAADTMLLASESPTAGNAPTQVPYEGRALGG